MTNAGGGNWTAHIDCAVPGTMKVVYTVLEANGNEVEFTRDVGTIALIDPQGIVHDRAGYDAALAAIGKTHATATDAERAAARDAAAIEGATVTLQRLVGGDWVDGVGERPGHRPERQPAGDRRERPLPVGRLGRDVPRRVRRRATSPSRRTRR